MTSEAKPAGSRRVLIVDDSGVGRKLVRRCLEFAGCGGSEFLEAGNGAEALKHFESGHIDLLVTDLNMPVMDGMELLRALAADRTIAPGAILVMSSAANDTVREDVMRNGAIGLVAKPVSPAELAKVLAPVLRGGSAS
jgi:two-component system chemotaxis response regulator CheY